MKKYDPKKPLAVDNLPKPWTVRQFKFASAYVGEAECIASKAAEIAGYSAHTAYSIGARLLKNVEYEHIQDYIKQELGGLFQKFEMTQEAMLQRLAEMTHSRLTDVVELHENGFSIKPTSEIPDHALGALKSITHKTGNTDELSVSLHCPIAAMREAAKLQKLYDDLDNKNGVSQVNIYIPDNGRNDPAHADAKRVKESDIDKMENESDE